MLPDILTQLGPEGLNHLKRLANNVVAGNKLLSSVAEEDDVPNVVENFEEVQQAEAALSKQLAASKISESTDWLEAEPKPVKKTARELAKEEFVKKHPTALQLDAIKCEEEERKRALLGPSDADLLKLESIEYDMARKALNIDPRVPMPITNPPENFVSTGPPPAHYKPMPPNFIHLPPFEEPPSDPRVFDIPLPASCRPRSPDPGPRPKPPIPLFKGKGKIEPKSKDVLGKPPLVQAIPNEPPTKVKEPTATAKALETPEVPNTQPAQPPKTTSQQQSKNPTQQQPKKTDSQKSKNPAQQQPKKTESKQNPKKSDSQPSKKSEVQPPKNANNQQAKNEETKQVAPQQPKNPETQQPKNPVQQQLNNPDTQPTQTPATKVESQQAKPTATQPAKKPAAAQQPAKKASADAKKKPEPKKDAKKPDAKKSNTQPPNKKP